jgi:WD40 repeat protein
MRVLKGHTGKLRAVAYSPDGAKLATAGDAGVTILWDASTGRELSRFSQPETGEYLRADEKRVGHLAFSRDGKLLVTGTGGYYVSRPRLQFWEVETARPLPFADELNESGTPMDFTPDDTRLIFAQGVGIYNQPQRFSSSVLAWNRETGTVEGPFIETRDRVTVLAVSASADLLAIAAADSFGSQLRLWNLTTRRDEGKLALPKIPHAHLRSVLQGMAFSPDGTKLAVAGGTDVFTFNVRDRVPRSTIRVHENEVAAVAYSPNGQLLATASQDGSVRLWDADALTERGAFDWGLGKLRAVAFAPDGLTIAVVGEKNKVVIWDVDAG